VQVGFSAKEPSVAQYIAREAEGEPDVDQVIGRAGQVAHVSLGTVRVGKDVVVA